MTDNQNGPAEISDAPRGSINEAADLFYHRLFKPTAEEAQSEGTAEPAHAPIADEEQGVERETTSVADTDTEDGREGQPEPEGEGNDEELQKGYLRQSDYTRKTMELADKRRSLETREKEIETLKSQYANQLQQAIQLAQTSDPVLNEGQKTDWVKLANDDPAGYVQKWATYQNRIMQINAARQQQAQLFQETYTKRAAEQGEILLQKVTEWKGDRQIALKELNELEQYALGQGYSQQDLQNAILDHRNVLTLRKAMLLDRAEKAKASVKDKKVVSPAPRTQKPGVEQSGQSPAQTQSRRAVQKAMKSQTTEDWANVIMRLRKP